MSKSLGAFGIYKNVILRDYCAIESISSILPEVDRFIINIGVSEDKTEELIRDTFGDNKKCHIFTSPWTQGRDYPGIGFLSEQTNLALYKLDTQWAMYLQADEVMHENDSRQLKDWIDRAEREDSIALTFNYLHFYKDYNHLRKDYKNGGDAYDREIRCFKNTGDIFSWGDAQSFTTTSLSLDPRGPQPLMHETQLLLDSPLNIYHLGWVHEPKVMLDKKRYLADFYNISEPGRNEKIPENESGGYDFQEEVLEFKGEHPKIMRERIERFDKKGV